MSICKQQMEQHDRCRQTEQESLCLPTPVVIIYSGYYTLIQPIPVKFGTCQPYTISLLSVAFMKVLTEHTLWQTMRFHFSLPTIPASTHPPPSARRQGWC